MLKKGKGWVDCLVPEEPFKLNTDAIEAIIKITLPEVCFRRGIPH